MTWPFRVFSKKFEKEKMSLPRQLLSFKNYLSSSFNAASMASALEGKEAAVLVPFLFPPAAEGKLSVLFTVRSVHLKSHSGQVRYIINSILLK
jgi:hypothetical protein